MASIVMVMVDHGLSKGVILAPCTKTVESHFQMVRTTWKSHVRPQTPIHLSLCQRTHKTPTIQHSSLLYLSPTNWWRNRTLQPRTQNLPLRLLWRTTPEIARTPPHGRIHLQRSCIFSHWQIPILSNYGIWTMILSTPWKDLPSSSQAATQSNWGYIEGSWSCPQIGTTTYWHNNI